MKQNSQWLSHVCTRSKIDEESLIPRGSPAFGQQQIALTATIADRQLRICIIDELLVLDNVGWHDAIYCYEFRADGKPRLSGGTIAHNLDNSWM